MPTPATLPSPAELSPLEVRRIIETALAEDLAAGDVTTRTVVPPDAVAEGTFGAREPLVVSGIGVAFAVFQMLDARVEMSIEQPDGSRAAKGSTVASLRGPGHAVLTGERVALNLLQRMCGIATRTRTFVDAVPADSPTRIIDTRKTTPGLRALERYAVRCGGGHNHRHSLSDAVMAKDNHLAVIGAGGRDLTEALREAKSRLPHTVHVEVEVDRPEQIEPVLAAGVDTILLDNFTIDGLRAGVEQVAGRALVEASGNVTLETVRRIAETGVDIISSGAMTHSVRALDLGLDIRIDVAS
jgi:nicotinate-nucleotide pyrophosphorylase (carboxylating)